MRVETETHCLELRVRGKDSRPLRKGLSGKEGCRGKGRMGKERWEEGGRGGGGGGGREKRVGGGGKGEGLMRWNPQGLACLTFPCLSHPLYTLHQQVLATDT